jgi:UDP-N-acetylmuramyl pentapeptide synthase
MSPTAVHYVPSSAEAVGVVDRVLEPGDLVLVKGSRGIRCDVIVDHLVQERS